MKFPFFIGLYIVFLSFFVVITTESILSKTVESSPKVSNEEKVSSQSAVVKYDLAYPGILPDHPLFKLKVLRDKLAVALITDPLKKVDYLLLQTDKGILAAAMLVDKKNIELATQTALKAEHNYTLLTQELYNLPEKPKKDFFSKLETASKKHQEVLLSLSKRVDDDDKKIFDQVADFSKRNWKSVESYRDRKIVK